MFRYRPTNPNRTWLDALEEIKGLRAEYREHINIMTPYERQVIQGEITKQVERDYGMIAQGVRNELEKAKSKYLAADKAYKEGRKKEINSWNVEKLSAERRSFQAQVDSALDADGPGFLGHGGADASKIIKQLYQEAVDSGDKYKIRAAGEVLASIGNRVDRLIDPEGTHTRAGDLRSLSKKAAKDIEELRTAELKPLLDAKVEAVHKVGESLQIIEKTAEFLGEPIDHVFTGVGTFDKLRRSVGVDTTTGEPIFYAEDSPEVTGVNFKPAPEHTEGG